MDIRLRADVNGSTFADSPDEAFEDQAGDLLFRQPHDRPADKERLNVFRGVGDESGCAIVPATTLDKHAALDLENRFASDVCEVCAPFALRVKHEFALQFRAAEAAPVEGENFPTPRASGQACGTGWLR